MRTLTMDELQAKVPAAFNTLGPSAKVSGRYKFVPSLPIIEGIMAGGWRPVAAYQQKTKVIGGEDFTKHFIRFRQLGDGPQLLEVGDVRTEIIYSNAHNALASNRLTLGLYRCVCSNQMTVKDKDMYSHAIRHVGTARSEVVIGLAKMLGMAPRLHSEVTAMSNKTLNGEQQRVLAAAATLIRWGKQPIGDDIIEQLLRPRRFQDQGDDLWRVYNRVQENLIKGNFYTRDVTKKSGQQLVRPVKSFVSQTDINQKLWSAAAKLLNS